MVIIYVTCVNWYLSFSGRFWVRYRDGGDGSKENDDTGFGHAPCARSVYTRRLPFQRASRVSNHGIWVSKFIMTCLPLQKKVHSVYNLASFSNWKWVSHILAVGTRRNLLLVKVHFSALVPQCLPIPEIVEFRPFPVNCGRYMCYSRCRYFRIKFNDSPVPFYALFVSFSCSLSAISFHSIIHRVTFIYAICRVRLETSISSCNNLNHNKAFLTK